MAGTFWDCPKCGYLKTKPCPYRGHRSYPVTEFEYESGSLADRRRGQWRDSKRRIRGSAKWKPREAMCANPECVSPFLPVRRGQVYCQDSCRDRAKYLRRHGVGTQ